MRPRIAALVLASLVVSCTAPTPNAPPAGRADTTSGPAAPAPAPTAAAAAPDVTPAAGVLTVISDTVKVGRGGGAATAAADGDLVRSGDTVRTEDGRAVITFIDGSTVEIEPSSELVIDTVAETNDGGIVVALTQLLGQTWHVVSKLGATSSYQVRTPASTAAVRGTAFQVGVDLTSGTPVATIETHEGAVATTAAGKTEEVLVRQGSATTVKKGDDRPAAPRGIPEPARKAIVTIGDTNSVVVDTLGRANGLRDGRPVLQTPGAKLEVVDGRLVVTLPNAPDGKLTTVVGRREKDSDDDEVEVETKVEERGGRTETVRQKIQRTKDKEGSGGVEVKRGTAQPAVKPVEPADQRTLKQPRIGKVPERPSASGRPQGSARPLPSVTPRLLGTPIPIRTLDPRAVPTPIPTRP
jgi:hypothetical protein